MATAATTSPIDRAMLSLDGLSVGDAFGQCFFSVFNHLPRPGEPRHIPRPPWVYTDDTVMACGIVEILARFGRIDQDALAQTFAQRYMRDPRRGYGGMARRILTDIYCGEPWQRVSSAAFDGNGSMGNGSAMRVAPLGAFFAHDIPLLIEQAALSAQVTHAHREGEAGAIAIALAAAYAWNHRAASVTPALRRELLDFAYAHAPAGITRDRIAAAAQLPRSTDPTEAARTLGNGSQITCPDTVPICLWLAARRFDDYAEAMWSTVQVLGDIDTNCAIVGGIVALSDTSRGIPKDWLAARGPIPLAL